MFVLKDNAFNKCAVVIVVVVVVVVYEMFFVFVFYSVRIVELNTPSLKCAIRNSHCMYTTSNSSKTPHTFLVLKGPPCARVAACL